MAIATAQKNVNHADCCNLVRLAVSELGGVSLPYTTGMFQQIGGGRPVKVGIPGASDIVACVGGRFVGIEVKVDRDPWRPEQRLFADALREAGGLYVLARFTATEDGVETLKEALCSSI